MSHAFETLYPSRRVVSAVHCLQRNETWINVTCKTEKAPMMWKHPQLSAEKTLKELLPVKE
jgi:hypothetical protein